jgi:hypothetical protein
MAKRSNPFKNYLLAWKNCLQSIKHGQIFLLFMAYAFLQVAFILVLMFFAYPPFSSLLVPAIKKWFGESALHYPNNYLVLPSLFFWVNLFLSGLFGVVLIAVTTQLFSMAYRNQSVQLFSGLKSTFPRYFVLFFVWILETLAFLAVFFWGSEFLRKFEFFTNKGNFLIHLITSVFAIIILALFVYTTASVILEKRGAFKAIFQSLSLFRRYPIISVLLIAIPNMIRMPLELLAGKTQLLVSRFVPEAVAVVLISSVFVSILANYLMVGTVTGFFLFVKK